MTNFMCSNNNSTEAASVFYDCDTVDLFESFINNASTTNISEALNPIISSINFCDMEFQIDKLKKFWVKPAEKIKPKNLFRLFIGK